MFLEWPRPELWFFWAVMPIIAGQAASEHPLAASGRHALPLPLHETSRLAVGACSQPPPCQPPPPTLLPRVQCL